MDGLSAPAVAARSRSLLWELCGLVLVAALWRIEPWTHRPLSPGVLALLLLPFGVALAVYLRSLHKQRASELLAYEQARRLLRNQEAQGQTLLAAFPDRIMRLDAAGNISELGGGSSAQRSLAARVLPEAALAALRAAAREVLETGQVGRVEYQIQEQGDQLHYEARLARAGHEHVLITVRAVTQRRRLEVELITARETALEAARLKTKFLANMSHEIRTPMNGVIGMTNLLMETPLSAEQYEYAQIIQKSGQTLLTVQPCKK